jgi:hypothetical protein
VVHIMDYTIECFWHQDVVSFAQCVFGEFLHFSLS